MNKKIITLIILFFTLFLVTGCGNQDMWDTEYEYNYAYCDMKNLSKEIEIKQWRDYDGEQIQIRTRDGNTYLISTNNCFLTKEKLTINIEEE